MTREDLAVLNNDPLFQRLLPISQAVQAGRADDRTLQAWAEMIDTVQRAMRAPPNPAGWAIPYDRERRLRLWIQDFADQHWPQASLQ